MIAFSPRQRKMMDMLLREIAKIIRQDLTDPRIGQVTVTEVKLSKDFSSAKIYVSSMQEEHLKQSVIALNHARSRIKALLAQRIETRIIPAIHFEVDQSILKGDRLLHLIDENMRKIKDSG